MTFEESSEVAAGGPYGYQARLVRDGLRPTPIEGQALVALAGLTRYYLPVREPLWRRTLSLLQTVLNTYRDATTVRMVALTLALAASTTMVVPSIGVLLLANK